MINAGALAGSKAVYEVLRMLCINNLGFAKIIIKPDRAPVIELLGDPSLILIIDIPELSDGYFKAKYGEVLLIWQQK